MSSNIQIYEDAIVTALIAAFTEPKPFITADLNFGDKGDGARIIDEAKLRSSSKYGSSAIFVGFTGIDPNLKTGLGTGGMHLYTPFYKYAILMYARSRRKTSRGHIDIYTLIETAMETLYKLDYRFFDISNIPVKIDQTGLYSSTFLVGNYQTYPNTLLT